MENNNEQSKECAKENETKEDTDKAKENTHVINEALTSEKPVNEIKDNNIPSLTPLGEKNTEEIKPENSKENTNVILDNLIAIQKLSKKNMSLKQLCKLFIIILNIF